MNGCVWRVREGARDGGWGGRDGGVSGLGGGGGDISLAWQYFKLFTYCAIW